MFFQHSNSFWKMTMLYRRARLVCPLLALLGCVRSSVLPEPAAPEVPVASSPVSTPVTGSTNSWTIVSNSDPNTYASVSQIVLEQISGSRTTRDSMTIQTQYSLAFDRTNESMPISGRVDRFAIQAGNRIGPVSQSGIPVLFSGRTTKGQITINPATETQMTGTSITCPNSWSTMISGVRRNVFLLPSQISRGMTWIDSTSSMTCHGSTPISLTNRYTYRVIGETNRQGTPAILIERTGKNLLNGQGSEGQHRVAIIGEGSTSGSFHIDPLTGVLLDAEDKQETKLIVTSSGRNQEFAQTIRERITRIDW